MVPAATARLTFRTWRDDDLPLARALFGDPRITDLVGGPFDDVQIRARLAAEIATEREHGFQYWPMVLADGGFAGCCGLKPRAPGIHELGFYLMVACWGRGLATEAARSVIAHAFGPVGAVALFAGHHPENHVSRHALAKLGFRYTHDEIYPPTGMQNPGYEPRR